MYKERSEFEAPDTWTIIRLFVGFTKFISYLDKNALFFVRSDKLFDRYEGKYTEVDVKLWKEILKPKITMKQAEIYNEFRKIVNLSSWHMNQNESAAMWEICLQSNEGVAIQSTFKRLKDSFTPHKEDEVHIGKVKYIDYEKDSIPNGNYIQSISI